MDQYARIPHAPAEGDRPRYKVESIEVVMLDRIYRLPFRSSFPRSGSCCVSNTPRVFLYLSAIGGHVRLLPFKK